MCKASDIGGSVGTILVADGNFDHLHVEFRGTKQQIKIPEWVEIPEIGSVLGNSLVVGSKQNFGPAEGVLDTLIQQPRKRHAEKLVAQQIEEPHGLPFHGVYQSTAVNEFALLTGNRIIKFRQVFRRHRKICI